MKSEFKYVADISNETFETENVYLSLMKKENLAFLSEIAKTKQIFLKVQLTI